MREATWEDLGWHPMAGQPEKPEALSHKHPIYVRSREEKQAILARAAELRPDPTTGFIRVSTDICGTLSKPEGWNIKNSRCDPTLPPNSMTFGSGAEA